MSDKENYYITEAAKERFRRFLFDERITFNQFAKRTGKSRQYLDKVIKGKIRITATVREHFKKGGYEFL